MGCGEVVVDTSAIVAILQDEPEQERFAALIEADSVRLLSAVTRVELTCVVEGRKAEIGRQAIEQFLARADFDLVSVTPEHAEIACEAFRRYGKGRHPAALNIGDCFAYALAKATGQPLLYKGDDFARTDVPAVA
jgi:ribonuclease VapC